MAANEAAAIHGVRRLSMADVARRSGYSRPTVYKHFPSKDALVAAVVQHETAVLVDAVLAEVHRQAEPQAALQAGVLTALRLVREHPLLDRIVRTEPETLVPLLTTDASPVLALARMPVQGIITRRFPDIDEVAARRLADMITRLLISYALSAPDDPPEVVAAVMAGVLTEGTRSFAAADAGTPTGSDPPPAEEP
jgi:AcrR family transcriptional regulator